MIIIKKSKLLISFVFLSSCSVQQQIIPDSDCKKFNIESSTNYNGLNESIIYSMSDFNSNNTKSLDIVRILTDSGYDTTESFKRVYIENGTAFIYENKNLKTLNIDDLNEITKIFSGLNSSNTMINCTVNSSRKYIYRYFVKRNGKLIITFYANNQLNKISKDLILENFKYLDFFESLK